jgi:hypothetical protein
VEKSNLKLKVWQIKQTFPKLLEEDIWLEKIKQVLKFLKKKSFKLLLPNVQVVISFHKILKVFIRCSVLHVKSIFVHFVGEKVEKFLIKIMNMLSNVYKIQTWEVIIVIRICIFPNKKGLS